MWFKNIFIYRLPADFSLNAATLQEKLASKPLLPCNGLDKQSIGWVSCRGDDRLVHVANNQVLVALGVEHKLLPASIIHRFSKERAAELEAQQGYKVGRKQLKDLKQAVADELLPRAFALQRTTYAWLDLTKQRLIIEAASVAKAEELLEFLVKTLDNFAAQLLKTELAPMAAMTNWLVTEAAPAGFTIDRELELRSSDENKSSVRYANHALEGKEFVAHISAGKRVARLGLTWNDRISFVLNEQCQLKRISFLDIIKDESANVADTEDDIFEVDFLLMTGELSKMLDALIDALGGEGPIAS